MTNQVQKSIRTFMHCLQHEGNLSKAPLHLIVSTAPMDLLHADFNSIEMIMDPNRLPKFKNILVFQDHLHKACYGICDPQSDCKDHHQVFVPGLHLNLWSSDQAPK